MCVILMCIYLKHLEHRHVHAHMHTRTHTHTHTQTQIHTHTHTHKHTHTHTPTRCLHACLCVSSKSHQRQCNVIKCIVNTNTGLQSLIHIHTQVFTCTTTLLRKHLSERIHVYTFYHNTTKPPRQSFSGKKPTKNELPCEGFEPSTLQGRCSTNCATEYASSIKTKQGSQPDKHTLAKFMELNIHKVANLNIHKVIILCSICGTSLIQTLRGRKCPD